MVLYPRDSRYDGRLNTYYSKNAAQPPACMVVPLTTEDVADIARTLSTQNCSFGMRSGAHSAFSGSNGLEGGVTVDFAYMNSTVYHPSTGIASVQPGSNWGNVYSALEPFGVTAVGGRASVVGVGGFTTGGGYSFHTGTQGFACNSVINFQVILANGTIRALKGGSRNFGFITRIDISQVLGAYTNFINKIDRDLASQIIVTLLCHQKDCILVAVLTNSQAQSTASAFNKFARITNISSTARTGTVAEIVPEFTGLTPLRLYARQGSNVLRLKEVVTKGPNQKLISRLLFKLKDNPILHYRRENIKFMRNVSRRYDPTGGFQHLRRTGFHIP
ncbi:FAD-binding domain-containing protein [Colletotrichum zoysiae]|uniref:FAD-binding domain-containing protein n=1 Tax=Colletotrichum zoysiae TaxID=1216348 RepID=A0AAD9H6V1_9PEZI|nr:FAD-binding domain-containing protein [Colletotrichum zoysiae]